MNKDLNMLMQGVVAALPENELAKKLASGKKLVIKLGMDPTSPDLHLGHAVVLKKLKQFQDLGHKIIFLIGDFTAAIGDPTGKSKTRPPLSKEAIAKNTQTYFEQVGRILDPKKVEIRYNSEWLDKLTARDFVGLCAKVTVARLIEREDFANRLKQNQPISFHELLYPLMQGYDSVELAADIELGGTDQTFNLLMGRLLQEQYAQEPQVILTTPLIEGLDGVQKMSKSLNNYIGLTEKAEQAFGKLMSISDELMWRYAKVLLLWSDEVLTQRKLAVFEQKEHPMNLKKEIAHAIVALFWSAQEADSAQQQFESLFQKKDLSQAQEVALPAGTANPLWIVDLLKTINAVTSSSEVKRLIESKAIEIDGIAVSDFKALIAWQSGMVLKVGKHRIYKLT
ncbi:MAG: tyrosine--tRNA ligase [Proteobacteria bacterium]|nr:tyrosine--tRNA ligase [Pseudomonadota bacterium]NBP13948.1 tyrosine--tRNA ligase [bacterium]